MSRWLEVRPSGRNVRASAIRQSQDQMELPLAVQFAKHLENLTCQRVVRPDNPNLCGQVLEGGSVVWVPSTTSVIRGWARMYRWIRRFSTNG
jgi:hypothetical protein